MDHIAKIKTLKLQLAEEKEARRQAETALKKCSLSESNYATLFNLSEALICTHDLDGKLLKVNAATCRLMQYSEEELLGRNIHEFIPENRREEFLQGYIPSIRKQKSVKGVLCIHDKSGKKIFLLFQNHRVIKKGLPSNVFCISQDISERIYEEHQLLQGKKLMEEAAQAKEIFLANMSHEIRTPMNGILGVASLLAKTDLNNRQRNFCKLIQDSANNLLVIVNDVLDLEKIIAGKLQFENIPFKIVDKIALTVQSFIYRAEEKGLGIIYQNSIPGDLVVSGDPFRMSQVLNNILSNAIKFTDHGNIIISTGFKLVDEEKVIIQIGIKDSGIGISEEKLPEIFKPFVQANSSISRKYGGTGLGLSICKNLLEMQGGSLGVKSRENFGTTFTFQIPYLVSKEQITVQDLPANVNYFSLGKKKVLVAEDVELNQFIAKHMMESWGFVVSIAKDGLEAVDMVEANDYDMVLMDVQMPQMDGITATKNIRILKHKAKAAIPIIALTANALKGDSEKYVAAGMNDYLSKPFDEAKLFQVIQRNFINGKTKMINMKEYQAYAGKPAFEEKLYDLSTIITVSGGDEDFVRKMVGLFIETVPSNLKELSTSMEKRNWDMVSKMAHKLKSTVDSMGIHTLKQDIRTVEVSAKNKEAVENIPALVHNINVTVRKCMIQLESHILQQVS